MWGAFLAFAFPGEVQIESVYYFLSFVLWSVQFTLQFSVSEQRGETSSLKWGSGFHRCQLPDWEQFDIFQQSAGLGPVSKV